MSEKVRSYSLVCDFIGYFDYLSLNNYINVFCCVVFCKNVLSFCQLFLYKVVFYALKYDIILHSTDIHIKYVVLSHVVVDVNTELAQEGVLLEVLYADDLF